MVARWVQWWWSDPGGETHQERHMVHRGVWCTILHSYMVHHGDIHHHHYTYVRPCSGAFVHAHPE